MVRKPSSLSTFFRWFFLAAFPDTDHIIRSAKRRSTTFLNAPEPKTLPRAILLRRPESHAPACGPLSGAGLLPAGLFGAVLHFYASVSPLRTLLLHFFGISASVGLLSAFDDSSLPWLRPVCALGRPLLHPQSLFSFVWVPTYQVLLPQLWSDLPLGLSSIQT